MTKPQKSDGQISVRLPLDLKYTDISTGSQGRGTIVLLHGYRQSKDKILKLLGEELAPFADHIVAVNAPFPIPFEKEGVFQEAYSWYFASTKDNRFLVPAAVCEFTFDAVIKELDLKNKEVTVIGYSQGGFALPWFGRQLPSTKQLIGLSCGFIESYYEGRLEMPLSAVHGEQDKVVDAHWAEEQFKKVTSRTAGGSFTKVPGGHKISSSMISSLQELLSCVAPVL